MVNCSKYISAAECVELLGEYGKSLTNNIKMDKNNNENDNNNSDCDDTLNGDDIQLPNDILFKNDNSSDNNNNNSDSDSDNEIKESLFDEFVKENAVINIVK